MIDAFIWIITVELLSLIALPATFVLFKSLPDRGYAFGKALSILIISFLLWLAASAHILPNTQWAIILIIALLAVGSLFLFIRRRHQIMSFISENRRVIIATEAIFLLSFVLIAVVRAYNPEIIYTEKPMDFAFLNSILRSDYFPPNDPWLSGHALNNYYFGHMIMATLTKLTGISSAVTFNLSLALVFALAAIGAFSIVYNLVRLCRGGIKAAIGFGLAAAGFLLLLGNLEVILELFYAHGVGSEGFWDWVNIKGLDTPYHSAHWYPTEFWWWWRSTRVIDMVVGGMSLDYTINEFPSFSFILGDLHAHILSLPVVLLCLTLSLNILNTKESLGLSWLRRNILPFLIIIICLGALGPIHTWDLPICLFIFIGAIFIQTRFKQSERGWLKGWLALSLIMVVGVFLLYLPFYLTFENPVSGILPWRGPDTRLFHYLIIWGLFLFIGISFALAQIRSGLRSISWRTICSISVAILLLWIIWAIVVMATGGGSSIWGKLGHLVPLLILLGLITLAIVRRIKEADNDNLGAIFTLLLFFAALLLTIGCELFYVGDVFGTRMNTVFRFYFSAWVLFAIASAFSLYYLHRSWKVSSFSARLVKFSWWGVLIILVIYSFIYPITATWSKTNTFSASPTLNGLAWLQRSHPEEFEAVTWLNNNVDDAPVIVEAPGGEYTDYGRVSTYTGLPAILGWETRQWVWRGSDRYFAGRRGDIDKIYKGEDLNEVEAILEKYGVAYIYVGRLEREMYGAEVGEGFEDFMDVVFENDGVTIYKVRE
ncbi:MAG TPA: DUF2298 domain-containing protein [Dehalococcoidia bacterium]|nr:DUF2298 domain-containing protein [Dehalococcoidia bacterium]